MSDDKGDVLTQIADKMKRLQTENAALKRKYELLCDAVNQNDGECSPECDSYGHADDCKHQDMAYSLELLQGKCAALKRENEALVNGHKRIQAAIEPNLKLSVEALVAMAEMEAMLAAKEQENE